MTDIYFKCACKKSLAVDEKGVGRTIECPDCHKPVTVPPPAFRAVCPNCGNEILAPAELEGDEIQCANCAHYFRVTRPPAEAEDAPRQAAAPAPEAAAPRRVRRSAPSNIFGWVTFLAMAMAFAALLVFYLNHLREVNASSRALGEIMAQATADGDYPPAIAALGAAWSNYPQARNRDEAVKLIQRLEQSIQVSNALAAVDAVAATNLGRALENLIQAVHNNPLAFNRPLAESRLSQMRMGYAEKLMSDRTASMEAMALADTMRSVRQMGDLPLAIKMLENAIEDYPAATNRTDASRLLAQMQLGFNQTEALAKAMAEAEAESRFNLRRAMDLLAEALSRNDAAVNRTEAESMLARWKKQNIDAAIALQKQHNDSLALVQAVSEARKAGDLKAAVRILEDALQQHPDATNRVEVTAIIARIARGEQDTGARAGFGAGLALSPSWHYGVTASARTADDMQALLGSLGEPNVDARPYPSLAIYKKVAYLMPLEDAVQSLFLEKRSATKRSVTTPGFPENSFFYYTYSGIFEESFSQLLLVVDCHNQVVAVQLVEENPPKDAARWDWWGNESREYGLYDMIQNRSKSSSNTRAYWKNMTFTMQPQLAFDRDPAAEAGQKTHVLEGKLSALDSRDNATRARTRVYLPQPVVNLILFKLSGAKYVP